MLNLATRSNKNHHSISRRLIHIRECATKIIYIRLLKLNEMKNTITCPTCKTEIDLDDILKADIEKEVQAKYEAKNKTLVESLKQKEEEIAGKEKEFELKKKRENELFQERMAKETEALKKSLSEQLLKKVEEENKAKIEFLQQQAKEAELKANQLQAKELEVLNLNKKLKEQQESEAYNLEKQKLELEATLKQQLTEQLEKKAEEKNSFKIKELEQKLEQQSKLIDEQKRKMEQGSMEQQGEIQENLVKERLTALFPFDEITDVAKGKRGADIIQLVRNSNGRECGQIIYESKNTKGWNNDWVDKLQQDVREQKAEIGVLITQVLPKHIKNIGKEKSIWICGFAEFEGVAAMLREAVINIYESKQSQENKGDKMVMLYEYLNGTEFRQKWDAILSGFKNMKRSIDKQREFYNKTLSEQEQIANSILINANTFLGDIKGIAGSGMDEMKMLE